MSASPRMVELTLSVWLLMSVFLLPGQSIEAVVSVWASAVVLGAVSYRAMRRPDGHHHFWNLLTVVPMLAAAVFIIPWNTVPAYNLAICALLLSMTAVLPTVLSEEVEPWEQRLLTPAGAQPQEVQRKVPSLPPRLA